MLKKTYHDMWDAENLTRMICELQPGILINNRTEPARGFRHAGASHRHVAESIFNDPAYGRDIAETISPEVIAADGGKNSHSIIDLAKSRMVRGIRIEHLLDAPGSLRLRAVASWILTKRCGAKR